MQSLWKRIKAYLYPPPVEPERAIMLSGGGARAAYQAGVLRYISEAFPEAYFPIMTGVSAGAINTAHLANHTGSFPEATQHLEESWRSLRPENVFEPDSSLSLLWRMFWGGGAEPNPEEFTTLDARGTHGFVDTTPLWTYLREKLDAPEGRLSGIDVNLRRGRLKAAAVITTNYATGQTVTWAQGRDFDPWERPDRISINATLTVEHVMASTSIPLIFPAVRIGDMWYGDGGIRLSAPLAPAVHLGADRILVISTRYKRSRAEADEPVVQGYPPAAQIVGLLMNSIFIDALDQDAFTLDRINQLVDDLPPRHRHGMRPVRQLHIRPSVDLGKLAGEFNPNLPAPLNMLATSLGTDETMSPDWLSVLLFEEDYITRLLETGYADAQAYHDDLEAFFADEPMESRGGY